MSNATVTPEVLWAQRSSKTDAAKNFVYLTISVPDVPAANLKLDLKSQSLMFEGTSNTLKKTYHLDLEFYADIDVEESKVSHTAKNLELRLRKKELNDAYWPRLLKDTKKVHFLKTDFDKWVDEDEQNEVAEDDFSTFGGPGGLPGMGNDDDLGNMDFSKFQSKVDGMPVLEDDEGVDDDSLEGDEGVEDEEESGIATEGAKDAKDAKPTESA